MLSIQQDKIFSRQSSSAQLKLRGSRGFGGGGGAGAGSGGAAQDESYVALFMQRYSETDEYDGETNVRSLILFQIILIHLVLFVLFKYFLKIN